MYKVLVAIPALNEEATLASVLEELSKFHQLTDVVVIDDGSNDRTGEIALEFEVTLLTHPINLGVGAALGTAFIYAKKHGYTHLIQFDADGQHRPEYIQHLIEASSNFDLVIGSRFAEGGDYATGIFRRIAMKVIGRTVSKLAKSKLTDVTSGFRISGPNALNLFSQHYPVEYLGDTVESVILASKSGLKIAEIPVKMKLRAGGSPSQNVIQSFMYTLRIFLILALAIIRPLPKKLYKTENSK